MFSKVLVRTVNTTSKRLTTTNQVKINKDNVISPTARYWMNRMLASKGIHPDYRFNTPSELITKVGLTRCIGIIAAITFL